MPQPTLSSFEEDATRIKRLQEDNDALRLRLATLLDNPRIIGTDLSAPELPQHAELMDDFYIIAQ